MANELKYLLYSLLDTQIVKTDTTDQFQGINNASGHIAWVSKATKEQWYDVFLCVKD